MDLSVSIFFVSLLASLAMVYLKYLEFVNKRRNIALQFIARKVDPIAGSLTRAYNGFSISSVGRFLSLLGARLGIATAHFLFFVKNKFSKIAAKIYHTSRKIEANSANNQPSFFIKTIKEYREVLKKEREDKN